MAADDNEARGRLLVQVLVASGYDVVELAGPDTYLPAQVADAMPDQILIDTDSPSRDTLEQLTQILTDAPRSVVIFSTDDTRSTIEAGGLGVSG